ncbi:MAG: hypothetical protein ACRDK1_03350 [Solirubrobacterales bacterium]
MSTVAGILIAVIILLPGLIYLGLMIWGAVLDGRVDRDHRNDG